MDGRSRGAVLNTGAKFWIIDERLIRDRLEIERVDTGMREGVEMMRK
jgi:hypothetical protein